MAVSIEYLGNEYVLLWRDTRRNPDLKKFSKFKIDAMLIQQCPKKYKILQASTFITYRVYAQIQQLNSESAFPLAVSF
jgi:hypothetical protein